MEKDNNLHNVILVEHVDESYGIYKDREEAVNNCPERLHGQIRYQSVKFNWNKGQPLIDLGEGQIVTVVDLT